MRGSVKKIQTLKIRATLMRTYIASFLHALCGVAGCIYVAIVQTNVYLGSLKVCYVTIIGFVCYISVTPIQCTTVTLPAYNK